MDRDAPHVLDIAACARLVCSYVEGVTREDFMRNVQLQDSVIRRLEIAGEAAGRVSAQFRERHPAIPWNRMVGMPPPQTAPHTRRTESSGAGAARPGPPVHQ